MISDNISHLTFSSVRARDQGIIGRVEETADTAGSKAEACSRECENYSVSQMFHNTARQGKSTNTC